MMILDIAFMVSIPSITHLFRMGPDNPSEYMIVIMYLSWPGGDGCWKAYHGRGGAPLSCSIQRHLGDRLRELDPW